MQGAEHTLSDTQARLRSHLATLSPGARQEFLLVLNSLDHVRVDVIRQFHECGAEDMVELLVLREEELRRLS